MELFAILLSMFLPKIIKYLERFEVPSIFSNKMSSTTSSFKWADKNHQLHFEYDSYFDSMYDKISSVINERNLQYEQVRTTIFDVRPNGSHLAPLGLRQRPVILAVALQTGSCTWHNRDDKGASDSVAGSR